MSEGSRGTTAARRETRQIRAGKVLIGGDAPISVQSMTCTSTSDIEATLGQIRSLASVGADLVRVAVNDDDAAAAMPELVRESGVPLVADIHFRHDLALRALEAGIAKLRINPGNIGSPEKVREVAAAAADCGVPIRIGVNCGSLHKRYRQKAESDAAGAMVDCAIDEVEALAACGFNDVVVSLKSSKPAEVIDACRRFSRLSDVPQHLGVTEAGTLQAGSVRSVAAMSVLLAEGIGDTLRISLAADPVEEVIAAYHMLSSLGLRQGYARVVACPTCARAEVDVFSLAEKVEALVGDLPPEVVISVMGCVVNGPGEARLSDLGIAAGKSEVAIYRRGELIRKVPKEQLEEVLLKEIKKLGNSR